MAKKPPKQPEDKGNAAFTNNPFAGLGERAIAVRPAEDDKRALGEEHAPEPAPSVSERAKKPGARGRLVLRRETKHRGGKAVVVVGGLAAIAAIDGRAMHELAGQLKRELGCGGTVDESRGEIVLQGDRPAKVAELLRGLGFRVDGVTS